MVHIFIPFTKGNLTTETKPDVVFHVSRVPRVDFSCALRVFSEVLQFPSLSKRYKVSASFIKKNEVIRCLKTAISIPIAEVHRSITVADRQQQREMK